MHAVGRADVANAGEKEIEFQQPGLVLHVRKRKVRESFAPGKAAEGVRE